MAEHRLVLPDTVRNPYAPRVAEPQMRESTPRRSRKDPARNRRIARTLAEIPDDQLTCRAGRHDWPFDKLQAGKPIPKGLRTVPQIGGQSQIIDTCQRCGKVRQVTTNTRNVYDTDSDFVYSDPDGWVTLDDSLDVTKRELRAENVRRNADRLFR